jgi:intracellular sulfur oxidation DsrE/DsrF family protein
MNARVILHAPTPAALARARSNLRNLARADPAAEIRILANAAGVAAALDRPDAEADRHLVLCENSLRAQQLTPPETIATVPAVVQALVELQAAGWIYIRA